MFEQLTDTQSAIIELNGKNILKACPGSGKTFVVAHKLVYDFKTWTSNNSGMAILSFTNVAKKELDNKIQELSGLKSLPYPHFLGTLDAFISQFIFMPFGQLVMKCSSRPSIIEQDFNLNYSSRFWKAACYKNGCDPNQFYIDPLGNVYDTKSDFSKCPFDRNEPCVKLKVSTYSKGYATYKEALLVAINILENYPEIRTLITRRFPYFVIDESQDTSEEQMQLLNLLFKNGVENAILIGDPDQAIYEWRDADPSVFLNMYQSSDWNSIELNENFRCSQLICNATKVFSSLSKVSTALGDTKDFSIKPMIMKYEKDNQDICIKKFLDLCINNDIKISIDNTAVLTRGRVGLSKKDYTKIKELWQTRITFKLAQATFYKGMQNVEKTISIIETILYTMIFGEELNVVDLNEIQKLYSLKEWNWFVFKLASLLPDMNISLKEWKLAIVNIIDIFTSEHNVICKGPVEIKIKSRVKDNNLKDFLEQPLKTFFTGEHEADYLCTTIHSVKGCTFEAVMLILNTSGKLTSNMINKKDIDSEEIRTFYVAATRAKKMFVLAIPDTVKDSSLVRFPKEDWEYI